MQRVELKQGSKEWLEFRRTRIMASDMAKLMGSDAAVDRLWKEKSGENTEFSTDSMVWGKTLEPEVLSLFNGALGETLSPAVIVRCDNDRFGASLDGLSKDGRIACEIKTTSSFDKHQEALSGVVPGIHVHQVQWQLYVGDLPELFYVSYCPDHSEPFVYFLVKRDDDLIQRMVDKATLFLDHMDKGMCPVEIFVVDDPILLEKGIRLEEILPVYKSMKKEVEELQEELKEGIFMQTKRIIGNIVMTPALRPGMVQYKKIPVLSGVDLDAYRGPPSVAWTFSVAS